MTFINSLKNGQSGIKLNIPYHLFIQGESEWGANLIDQKHQVYWHLNLSSGMLDLSPEHHDLMLTDIENYARTEFEFEFNQYCQEHSIEDQPRTADTTWSPVIEVKTVAIGTSKALYVLRRLAYQPSHEIVVGHLLIPTIEGTYELNAYSTTNSTGYRESLLFQQSVSSHPEFLADATSLEEFTNNFRQQDMDDPQHDQLFPEHPLSCIRAAMLWLLDNNGGNIQITKPLPPTEKEVKLLNLGCAIILPPRYVYNRAMAKLLSPRLAQFSRFALPDTGSGFSLGTFTIYKVPDVKLTGNNCQQKLIQLATKMLQDWKNEGVTNINAMVEF